MPHPERVYEVLVPGINHQRLPNLLIRRLQVIRSVGQPRYLLAQRLPCSCISSVITPDADAPLLHA